MLKHLLPPLRCGSQNKSQLSDQPGFITLALVLLVGAVSAAIAISLLLSGIGFTKTGLIVEQSQQAKALAHACAERGLETIREDNAFSGPGNATLGSGSCAFTVTVLAGENRTVDAVGTVGSVVRRERVMVSAIRPAISIADWQEVAD